jgi:segregation and condensation protein B
MPERNDLVAACEAVLAVAGEPVPTEALAAALGQGVSIAEVESALELVRQRHDGEESGLIVERVAGGWRLASRPELEGVLRAYLGVRARSRLSQAALETLAIIAYRQPVTLPEINFLRGVNSAGVVRTLLDRRLVRAAGRKKVVGTPLLYRTTREFLIHFGLDDLAALPDPEEADGLGGDDASVS